MMRKAQYFLILLTIEKELTAARLMAWWILVLRTEIAGGCVLTSCMTLVKLLNL